MTGNVIINNLPFLMHGLFVTLKVAFISIILSMLFGTVLGVARFAKIPLLSLVVGLFIDITRAVPLILYIIFIHFSISPYLYEHACFVNYLGINCLEMFSAVLAIVIFTSAYIAEIIRSGLASIENEQILAAKALALNEYQTMEYIILPQAITRMKPSLCAQFITLVKDTSLASAIGLIEFTRAAEIVYETSLHEFQILSFVALVYITINFLIHKILVNS
ncbi:MAG: amino acid ABC transporter permease [Candidatus Gastranaerophilales bacterium]|nr:amino acid ABC transporter permease [Candidatus Gastranaerophilales bacterium]